MHKCGQTRAHTNVSGFLLGVNPANNSQRRHQDKIKGEEKEKTYR